MSRKQTVAQVDLCYGAAQAPHVGRWTAALSQQHLWGGVVNCERDGFTCGQGPEQDVQMFSRKTDTSPVL